MADSKIILVEHLSKTTKCRCEKSKIEYCYNFVNTHGLCAFCNVKTNWLVGCHVVKVRGDATISTRYLVPGCSRCNNANNQKANGYRMLVDENHVVRFEKCKCGVTNSAEDSKANVVWYVDKAKKDIWES